VTRKETKKNSETWLVVEKCPFCDRCAILLAIPYAAVFMEAIFNTFTTWLVYFRSVHIAKTPSLDNASGVSY
jgi:hypothetical protein